jgi:hypothetical protein
LIFVSPISLIHALCLSLSLSLSLSASQGHNIQKFINIDHLPAAVVPRELIAIDEENQAEGMEGELGER